MDSQHHNYAFGRRFFLAGSSALALMMGTRHAKARAENITCIMCHFGIAHREPDGPGPQELKLAK